MAMEVRGQPGYGVRLPAGLRWASVIFQGFLCLYLLSNPKISEITGVVSYT